MALKTETRTIDGLAFTVTQLPARRAQRVFNRLAAVAAPLLSALGSGTNLAGVNVASLGGALGDALSRLSDAEFDRLQNDLLETARVDGKPLLPIFDVVLQGRISTSYKLLWFALEVNFADFRDALSGLELTEGASVSTSASG